MEQELVIVGFQENLAIHFTELNLAWIKIQEGIYELSKMAVDESFQGKNIGNKMLLHSIDMCKNLNATKLILYSNTILEPAIHLYKKHGFREVLLDHSEYTRSNIKMELVIN